MPRWRWTHINRDGSLNDRANRDHKAKRETGSLGPNCIHCGQTIAKETW